MARLSSLPPLQFYPIPVVEPVGKYPDPVHGVPDAEPAECDQLEDPGRYVAARSLGDIFPSQVFLGSNQILGLFLDPSASSISFFSGFKKLKQI